MGIPLRRFFGLKIADRADGGINLPNKNSDGGVQTLMTVKYQKLISPAFYEVHRAIKAEKINELVAMGGRGPPSPRSASGIECGDVAEHLDCHAVVLRKYEIRAPVFTLRYCQGTSAAKLSTKAYRQPYGNHLLVTGQKIYFSV